MSDDKKISIMKQVKVLIFCTLGIPFCILRAQTKLEVLKPEISHSFSMHRFTKKSHLAATISQQFYTGDENYFTGHTDDGHITSPLIYNRLSLMALRRFNTHWYGRLGLHTQLGRYYFYNYNRSFSTAYVNLGHKGSIDELSFYKEVGASINNQKPKSIKDLYLYLKFEYAITKHQKPFALASLAGKVDWLGTSFSSDQNDIFVLRAKEEGFIYKIDQSWLILNFDFFISEKNVLSTTVSYFTEYYPSADVGYDKRNIRHYVLGLAWRYYLFKDKLELFEQVY